MEKDRVLLENIEINTKQIELGESLISRLQSIIELTQKIILIEGANQSSEGLLVMLTSIYKSSKIKKIEYELKELDEKIQEFLCFIKEKENIIKVRKDLNISTEGIQKKMDFIFKVSIPKVILSEKLEILELELYKMEDEVLGVLNILRERECLLSLKVIEGLN